RRAASRPRTAPRSRPATRSVARPAAFAAPGPYASDVWPASGKAHQTRPPSDAYRGSCALASAERGSPSDHRRRQCRETHRPAASVASRSRRPALEPDAQPGARRGTHTGKRSRTIIRARLTIAWLSLRPSLWVIARASWTANRLARRLHVWFDDRERLVRVLGLSLFSLRR